MLFSNLFDTQHRAALETALQGNQFTSQLTFVLDSINVPPVPANDDMLTRVYSITALQMGNFDNYYEENEDFRLSIKMLLYLVEETGGVLANPVTPDKTLRDAAAVEKTTAAGTVERPVVRRRWRRPSSMWTRNKLQSTAAWLSNSFGVLVLPERSLSVGVLGRLLNRSCSANRGVSSRVDTIFDRKTNRLGSPDE